MGNVGGRENGSGGHDGGGGGRGGGDGGGGGGGEEAYGRSNNNCNNGAGDLHTETTRVPSASPLLFTPQVPAVPLRGDGPFFNHMQRNETQGTSHQSFVRGIPTLITWSYGGDDVAVEGSWDNWRSRKTLQRSGKDHTILLVLPSGVYHYKFVVDGDVRYIPDLPCQADERGHVCNLLDVNDYLPENIDGVREFEAPPSPDSSYGHSFPGDEDFAKEPVVVPPQLELTVLDKENTDEGTSSSTKPQHVVLDHLFVEKGGASRSVIALGLTHRFESKYVTLVLYKPLER